MSFSSRNSITHIIGIYYISFRYFYRRCFYKSWLESYACDHTNRIPDNYKVILTKLDNGKEVDSRIVPELSQMFRTARKDDNL